MSTNQRLSELLLQWEELHEQGRPASVGELCRDCPELADELRRRIAVLQAMPSVLAAPLPRAGQATLAVEDRHANSLTRADPNRLDVDLPPARLPEVPGYEVVGELGRGGMGIVYLALQQGLNRRVALKMLLAGAHANARQRGRFRSEVEAIARLQHPNVVQIFELGEVGGQLFCALEYVDGGNLADQLDGSPRPPRAAAELVAALADGLQSAHEQGIVHRDLKPANVLLTAGGIPKITDFGLARMLDRDGQTESGAVVGTPQYMAPEQARGLNDAIGPATDVHALGAILYELLTGRPPFRGTTTLETLLQVEALEPVRPRLLQPQIPLDLETVCLKCLRKQPEQRYASARALAEDLRRFLGGEPVHARPPSVWERALKWARRRPSDAVLLGVSLTALLAMVLVVLAYNTRLRHQRDQANVLRQRAEESEAEVRRSGEQAERMRKQAEANFRLALSVVDDYTLKLSEPDNWFVEDLRVQLLKSSLAYYQKFVKQHGEDPILCAAQGRAYLRLAQISGELGAKESRALGLYRQAEGVFEQLTRDHPKNADYQRELAQVRYDLGRAHRDLGQWAPAEKALKKARTIQEALVKESPKDLVSRRDLAQTWYALGLTCFQRRCGRPRVEAAFKKALAILEESARIKPLDAGDRDLLGDVHRGLGDLHRNHREYAAALEEYRKALEIEKQLVRDKPGVVNYQSDLGSTYYGLSFCYELLGDFTKARTALEESLAIRRRLANRHPGMVQFAADLGATLQNRARILGNPKARAKAYAEAVQTLEGVLLKEPRHSAARRNLAAAYAGRAATLDRLGRHAEALEDWDRLRKLEPRWPTGWVVNRATTYAHLGRHVRAADDAYKADTPGLKGRPALNLARTYAVCAKAASKDPALSRERRARLVEANGARAVALLAKAKAGKAFATGQQRQNLAKDPDFSALRGRADFRKWLDGK
jgi:serine/threonine protein kinase